MLENVNSCAARRGVFNFLKLKKCQNKTWKKINFSKKIRKLLTSYNFSEVNIDGTGGEHFFEIVPHLVVGGQLFDSASFPFVETRDVGRPLQRNAWREDEAVRPEGAAEGVGRFFFEAGRGVVVGKASVQNVADDLRKELARML